MSNNSLIKYLIIIRICFWYFILIICSLTRTIFIIQTWSKIFIFILILNFIFSLINVFTYKYYRYYHKFKYILVICLFFLTLSTLIVYVIYVVNVYYHLMNLLVINIMTNDRNESLLSQTLNHYQCCRIQENILFDSVNERDYFLLFPYCEKVILEYEMKKDSWDHITTCGTIFRSITFYIRTFFLIDFILNFFLFIRNLIYLWNNNDDDQCLLSIPKNINYKIK